MACEHEQFHTDVNIDRIKKEENGKVEGFMAEIRIHCTQCNEPFVFIAPVIGMVWDGPAVSPGGQELRAPIRPRSSFGENVALPGFKITRRER